MNRCSDRARGRVGSTGEEDQVGRSRRRLVAAASVVVLVACAPAARAQPAEDGLVALYDFEEQSGTVVSDVSGVGDPLDCSIPNAPFPIRPVLLCGVSIL